MRDRLSQLTSWIGEILDADAAPPIAPLGPLRAATAQLLLVTAGEVAVEQLGRPAMEGDALDRRTTPKPLAWAPVLLAPLTAAAHLEHARNPRGETRTALRLLNAASLAVGATLLVYEAFGPSQRRARRLGPLTFASAGLLGFLLEQHEQEIREAEVDLRRRANLVERLVPRRRPRLDRVVVHV